MESPFRAGLVPHYSERQRICRAGGGVLRENRIMLRHYSFPSYASRCLPRATRLCRLTRIAGTFGLLNP